MIRKKEAQYGFKTKSSVLEYENPYTKIYKDELILPDGKENTYWTISRPPFTIIIPLFSDNTTVLVGQYRIQADFYSWEFPMGSVAGAEPLDMAKQELHEETGYSAGTWEELGWYFNLPGSMDRKAYIFVAKDLTAGKAEPEDSEFIKKKRIAIADVGKMINEREILDGPTIIAFHYLEAYLGKQQA